MSASLLGWLPFPLGSRMRVCLLRELSVTSPGRGVPSSSSAFPSSLGHWLLILQHHSAPEGHPLHSLVFLNVKSQPYCEASLNPVIL